MSDGGTSGWAPPAGAPSSARDAVLGGQRVLGLGDDVERFLQRAPRERPARQVANEVTVASGGANEIVEDRLDLQRSGDATVVEHDRCEDAPRDPRVGHPAAEGLDPTFGGPAELLRFGHRAAVAPR